MKTYFSKQCMNESTAMLRKRRARVRSFTILILLIAFVLGSNLGYGQNFESSNSNDDGFRIRKMTSMTTINSGDIFYYEIHFTIPAGATNIIISDNLPNQLEYRGLWPTSVIQTECSQGTPLTFTESVPAIGERGGTYQLTIANAPCGASGSITIYVRFPVGITCDGTRTENAVCMNYRFDDQPGSLCTKSIITTAKANNTWKVDKRVLNFANQGGECPHAVNDSIIQYQIYVKHDGGTSGQLNLVDGIVDDQLPPGASLVPGSSNCITQNGSLLRWDVGNIPVSTSSVSCVFSVLYPSALFPFGSFIHNKATLIGLAGDSTKPKPNCANVFDTNSVCSELKEFRNGEIQKKVFTNSQQGCAGFYTLKVCNGGNVALTNVLVEDQLPDGITYNGHTANPPLPSGWNISFQNGLIILQGGSLSPQACVNIRVDFTINEDTPAGTVITNCATITADKIDEKEICQTFTVISPAAKACLEKIICSKKGCYSPGDTLTFRLRVQNIGGADISGAEIKDVLDQNLIYLGNVNAYVSSNGGILCGQSSDTSWGRNVIPSFNNTNNTVTFKFDDIEYNCNAYGGCNQNGDIVPYHFIEFQVKVSDSSAIGNINNKFSIYGGSLIEEVTSLPVSFGVCANSNYSVKKEVKTTGSNVYGETATISNGGSVDYLLSLQIPIQTPPLAPVRHVSFIEELPMNVNTTTDKNLMNCGNRGSMFGLSFDGSFTSSTNPSATPVECSISNSGYPTISTWGNNGSWAPVSLFGNGCSTSMNNSVWSPAISITPNTKNNGFYFGQWAFVPSTTVYPWVVFRAKADSAGVNDSIACNNFIGSGAVRRLINGISRDVYNLEVQSGKVCIDMIQTLNTGCSCDSLEILPSGWSGGSLTSKVYHIKNQKIPGSDICQVNINISPNPIYGSPQGGDLFTNNGGPYSYLPDYSNITLATPASDWVSFVYGIDVNNPGTYVVTITTIHCDGDSCVSYDTLNPSVPTPLPVVLPGTIKDSLRAVVLNIRGNEKISRAIKFITIDMPENLGHFVAIPGSTLPDIDNKDVMVLDNSAMSRQTVRFTLREPLTLKHGDLSKPFTLLWSKINPWKEEGDEIRVSIYDKKGNILAYDSASVITSVDVGSIMKGFDGSEFELLKSVPNPGQDNVMMHYIIGEQDIIKLAIYDNLGNIIKSYDEGFKPQGMHSLDINTEDLINGVYHVRLISPVRSTTLQLIINK